MTVLKLTIIQCTTKFTFIKSYAVWIAANKVNIAILLELFDCLYIDILQLGFWGNSQKPAIL